MLRRVLLAGVSVAFAVTFPAGADTPLPPGFVPEKQSANRSAPKAFKCRFASGFFSTLENGVFQTEPGGKMAFTIAAIDVAKGNAQLVGNLGASPLIVIRGSDGISFIERTPSGNMNVTTVYTTKIKAGGFAAVHSRHVGSPGDPMISQYLGSCEGLW